MKSMMVAGLFMAGALTGNAQSWKNPVNESWGIGSNWSGDAVPGGAALVAFTNSHVGPVTVTLDGNRTQTGGMTFGGGDWRIEPGTPSDSALTLASGSTITTLEGTVATLAAAGSAGTAAGRVAFRGTGEFQIDADRSFNTFSAESGTVRIMPGGMVSTASGADIHVDGTGRLILDGGAINTRIIRFGNDYFPEDVLFRMNSGTVRAEGAGDTVLLIGYRDDRAPLGQCTVEILGGSYSATGLLANAHVYVGARNHSSLKVGGSEIPASLNVTNIYFGWKVGDSSSFYTTNTMVVASNGTVNAGNLYQYNSRPFSTVRVEKDGTLRCNTVFTDAAGRFDFTFAGGRVLLNGVTNSVFRGPRMTVAMEADSELGTGGIDVAIPAPITGGGWLTKTDAGTLRLTGDLSAFSGGVAVAQGGLAVGDVPLNAAFGVALADGTTLDLTGCDALSTLEVSGATAVTPDAEGLSIGTLTLNSGVCTFVGDSPVTVAELHVPFGAVAEFACTNTISILSLTGGGTLIVSGGGTFDVTDDTSFTGTATAAQDTTLHRGVMFIERMTVTDDTAVNTLGQTVTVGTLTLLGGTLSAAGGGDLVIQNLRVDGVAALAADGAGAITNIASMTLEAGAELAATASGTIYFGAVQGRGTLRLLAGIADIAALDSGVGFDIVAGEVRVTPVPADADAPAWVAADSVFWVDASHAASRATVDGRLEWSDRRGGGFAMKAVSSNVVPTVVSEPTLGGLDAVKFASPYYTGAHKGMYWNQRLTNVRTVFWVVGAQEGGGQLLGDEAHIDFMRGEQPPGRPGANNQLDFPKGIFYAPFVSQVYYAANRDHIPNVVNGLFRVNGTPVNPAQTGYPNAGYHVLAARTAGDVCAASFAAERSGQNSDRSGCQRLAECIVFTNALTDAEIAATEAYLQSKWFGSGVRARSVRIGSAGARFTADGNVLLDELRMDVANVHPTVAVTGVSRVERLVVPHDVSLAYDAAARSLPLNAQTVRVEGGATATITAPAPADIWLASIEGTGTVALPTLLSAEIGGVIIDAGDSLTLSAASPVSVVVRGWRAQGNFEIAGASGVTLLQSDISGNARFAVAGGTATPVAFSTVRATDAWTLEGDIVPSIDLLMLYGNRQTFTLNAGGRDLRVKEFHGHNTFVWNSLNRINAESVRAVAGNAPILPVEAFVPYIATVIIGTNSQWLEFMGSGELFVNRFSVEGDGINGAVMTRTFTLAPSVNMTVTNFIHQTTRHDNLMIQHSGTLNIVNLTMTGERAIWFPIGLVTTVKTLALNPDTATGRVIVRDGTLRVTDSITTCRNFTVIGEGIIFPDGTQLTPTLWDVRTPARFGLGEGSALTLNLADYVSDYAMTFAGGTLKISTDAAFNGGLILDGTALEIDAGQTLAAASLTGHDTVTLRAGAVLNVPDMSGFDGTLVNNGGTLRISNPLTDTVPVAPVVAPSFWVDASESGSFVTNSPSQLIWLDKRTVRDGAAGMMYAISSNMPAILPGDLNGLPILDFGTLGAKGVERGMAWSKRLTNVRAVHWVVGAQNGGGMLLGDIKDGHIDYFRYNDWNSVAEAPNYHGFDNINTPLWPSKTRAAWATRDLMPNVVNGTSYMNGVQMTAPAESEGFPSADYHLLSIRTAGPTYAAAFASERIGGDFGERSGAQRLGEVLVYDARDLTERENRDNDAYLSWKWFARRLDGYRLSDDGLVVLRGSGAVVGENVLAREVAPAPAGLSVTGDLHLGDSLPSANVSAVIRLDTLPASSAAAVSVDGDVFLPSRIMIVLGEVRAGTFTVLEASGTLHGSAEWLIDTSAVLNATAYQISVVQLEDAILLKISGKGTTLLLR